LDAPSHHDESDIADDNQDGGDNDAENATLARRSAHHVRSKDVAEEDDIPPEDQPAKQVGG